MAPDEDRTVRDFLTGVAIILIVVLTTMLVAPYFVDWTGQRSFLEARLTHALGQKVTIGGNIDMKLLPTPYLVLDQVVVGGDDGAVKIGIHHLDLELTVAPLLHGAFDIVEARLVEPTIRINLEHDRTLPALPSAPAFQADVRFDRIRVSDGTLAVADPVSGRTFVFDHLDLDADADSFAGPFKVSGSEGPDGQRTKFHLATTAAEKGRTHARLTIEETPAHSSLELDGAINLADARDGTTRQSFDGNVVVAGHLTQGAAEPIAWKLSGPLKADPRQAAVEDGELRLGTEDIGVTLQAQAKVEFGETPKLALDLKAKQLDLDRLSGAPVDAVMPPPPKLPEIASLRAILAAAQPPVPTTVELAIDNATYGGETLSDLQARFGLGDEARQPLKLAGDGPGGSHLAIDGLLTTKPSLTFTGRVDLEADNLRRAVDWLGSVAPTLPWKGSDMAFKSVKLAGQVTAGPRTIEGTQLALTLDRSILNGTGRIDLGEESARTKLTAVLHAEALDLDGLPSFDSLRGRSDVVDLDVQLDAKAIKVSRVGDGTLDTGRIQLALSKTGRHVELKGFRADDLGGATIQAAGNLDPERGEFTLSLDAAHLEAAAALARQLAPGAVADALVARAGVLAPAKVKIDATFNATSGAALTPTRLAIAGTLGATRVDVSAKPDAVQDDTTSIAATLTAPDGSALLSQLGVPALPTDSIGASGVTFAARGHAGDPLDSTLAMTLGTTKLDVTGRFDILSASPTGSGTLRLHGRDLTPLLQSLAIAFPDMTGQVAADVSGILSLDATGGTLKSLKANAAGIAASGALQYRHDTGDQPALTGSLAFDRLTLTGLIGLAVGPPQTAAADALWSQQPFAIGLIDPPPSAFTLTAKTLEIVPGVEATNASLDLGIAPNVVTLRNVAGDMSGGRIDGGATVRRDGRQATVEGKVGLDRVALRLDALNAQVSAKLDFAGGGTSALAFVASLAGDGAATAADLSMPGGDSNALPKIFKDVENDALAVDQDAVIRAFTEAAKEPLAAGTRHFGLRLAAGTIHAVPDAPESAGTAKVSSKVDAAFDLTQSRIETHLEESLDELPQNWAGPPPSIVVTQAGPIGHLTRTIDASGFLNAVAARALARETARIEAYEFDIRERAIFNARLLSEQRREDDRLKAEADAKQAEAERQAQIDASRREAVRQERLRKEQAAKAAQEKAALAKAAQEEAAQEKIAQDRAAEENAAIQKAAERAARDAKGARDNETPAPAQDAPQEASPQPAPPASDPSALGRY